MKSPLSVVKERFGDKEKLVAAVKKLQTKDLWLDRLNDEKGLALVSNAKLIRLHDTLTTAQEQFGSRNKLISSILELGGRAKDSDYKTRLESFPLPRLLDVHRAADKQAKAKGKTPEAPKAKKVARSRKAQAKAAAK